EGAAHAAAVRLWRDMATTFNDRDWSAFDVVFAPDAAWVTHRKFSDELSDSGSAVAAMQSIADAVSDAFLTVSPLECDGEVTLGRNDLVGHTPDGGEVQWQLWNVLCSADGRFSDSELFEVEDEVAARARFAQLADERRRMSSRARVLDNAACR